VFSCWLQEKPIPNALTLFTDASGTGMAAYYSAKGHKVEQTSFFTAQHAKLQAVIMACCDFSTEAINVYIDSAYVTGVLRAIETAYSGHTNNDELFNLFCQLWSV
jgi:hypothetical protein